MRIARNVLLSVLLLLSSAAMAAEPAAKDVLPPAPTGKTWKLVWHDEFDGAKLDETKWVYRPDGKRKGGWWDWLDDRVQHTFHWDGYGKEHKSEGKVVKVPGVMEGFHTFAIWWTPEEYIFYVDGKETWRSKAGGVCQVPQYMLLSDEVGPWAGDINKAKLPDEFLVDYVRVYERFDFEVAVESRLPDSEVRCWTMVRGPR